jgi:hypothetical protein
VQRKATDKRAHSRSNPSSVAGGVAAISKSALMKISGSQNSNGIHGLIRPHAFSITDSPVLVNIPLDIEKPPNAALQHDATFVDCHAFC